MACVIPTHRRPHLVVRAVQSVRAQTLAPTEIVVVDDVGDDAVRESVTHVEGARYLDFSGETRHTAGSSRNHGARATGSDLLAFLDDDDLWDPEFLEKATGILRAADVDMVVSWTRLEHAGQRISGGLRPTPSTPTTSRATNPFMTGSNLVITRTAFDRLGGFDDGLPVFNDLDFLIRFRDAGLRLGILDEALVAMSSDGGEHLSSRGRRRADGIRTFREKHAADLSREDRRYLRQAIAIAERYPGQAPWRRSLFFVMTVVNARPGDLWAAVRRRLRYEPRAYS